MDTKSITDCLVAGGVISDGRAFDLEKIISKLPDSNHDLLKLIAASTAIGSDSVAGKAPIGVEAFASSALLQALDIPAGATSALITVSENNIIFRIDGGNPTATVGHAASVGDNFLVSSPQLENFKFIAATGSTTVFVTYF